ncbi:MAG: SdrD B-like domain-containing protein, partial [Coprobacillaceae bacterium]
MKTFKWTRLCKLSLAIAMFFSCFSMLVKNSSVSAESFDLTETIEINDDKTQANIIFNLQDLDTSYTVESIMSPNGTMMDLLNPSYTVDTNGNYAFTVKYYVDENQEEIQSITKEVEVTGLVSKGETSEVLPRTVTSPTGDSLTVTFNRDDGNHIDWSTVSQVDWNFYDSEQIEINAIFSQTGTEKERVIEIDVPDGYEIVAYSAKNGTTSKAGETVLTTVESTQQAMLSSSLVAQSGNDFGSDTITGYKNVNNTVYEPVKKSGKIRYVFNKDAENVILTLRLAIDSNLYDYTNKRVLYEDSLATISKGTSQGQLKDALKVSLTSGSETLEESVIVNVKGTIQNMYYHRGNLTSTTTGTYIDTDGYSPVFTPFGQQAYLWIYDDIAGNKFDFLMDEITIYYTYPVGAEFIEISETNFTKAGNMTVSNDTVNRVVTVTYSNVHINTYVSGFGYPKFKLNGDTYGTETGKADKAYFSVKTAFKVNGNSNYIVDNRAYTVNLLEQDVPLTILNYNTNVYDYKANGYENGYQFLGNYAVQNNGYTTKNDLDLEWSFSPEIGAKILRVAVPNGKYLKDIKVYTTSNPTGITLSDMKSSHSMFGIIIDGDKIGLAKDEYITKITGVVQQYPSRHTGTNVIGVPGSNMTYGYCAYGVLTNGNAGSHTLTIDSVSATVNVTPNSTRRISASSVLVNKELDPVYYPGDSIPVDVSFTASGYTWNMGGSITENLLQDPNIYIREPKGFSLDETSLKFNFNGDITDKATLKSKTTAADGAVIYTYTFDDPYTVMAGVQTKGDSGEYRTNNRLNVVFNLKVDTTNQGYANLTLRDVIMVEGKGNFVGYDSAPSYIRNDDFNLTGVAGKNLQAPRETTKTFVVKLPELQIFSGIRIKGDTTDFYTYDGTDSSIAALSRDRIAEVEISYKNSAPNKFETANIYFPIPKTGKDYGDYFNNKAINDPLNNVDPAPFTWTANMQGEIIVPGFTTYYALDGDINTTANDLSLTWEPFVPTSGWKTYGEVASQLDDVVFLKFVANDPIDTNEEGSFTFELKADDASPIDETNYWRTYSGAQPEGKTTQSWVVGSVLAGTLSVGHLKGVIFNDNNGNGIYDTGDMPYTGDKITLMLSEKNGKIASTPLTIESDGTYEIDMLKEREYIVEAINGSSALNFTQTKASTSTVTGSNAVANSGHTSGKIEGLVVSASVSSVYDKLGIGLLSGTESVYDFED